MVNRNILIGKVSPFLNKRDVLVANQDTIDIIDAMIKNHYKYSSEYDKIFRYFDGGSVEETAFNVWSFLKDNFKYTIEPESLQILRSPGAILASNIVGIDCKGYATFANGVMDAYRRNTGKKFDIYYRFASYDPFDNVPQHVFSVVNENGTEFWIDPVLDQFDEKKQPYYFKDKKIKNMALVAMSGINDSTPYVDEFGNLTNYSGSTMDNNVASSSGNDWLSTILKGAPGIIKAFQPGTPVYNQQQGGSGYNPYSGQQVPPSSSTGISTNTVLLLGAAGLAAYFIFRKK
jgi:hypothetical protein